MKIGVIGSRDYQYWELVLEFMDRLPTDTILVSGGARGVDTLAEVRANENGLQKLIYRANWQKQGRAAGFVRNEYIIENSEWVVAFWDGRSKGTEYSIRLADKSGKPLTVVFDRDEVHHYNGGEQLWATVPQSSPANLK